MYAFYSTDSFVCFCFVLCFVIFILLFIVFGFISCFFVVILFLLFLFLFSWGESLAMHFPSGYATDYRPLQVKSVRLYDIVCESVIILE